MEYRKMTVINASDLNLEVKRQFNVEVDVVELFWGGWAITSPYMLLYFGEQEVYCGFDDTEAENSRLRNLVRETLQDEFGLSCDDVLIDTEF